MSQSGATLHMFDFKSKGTWFETSFPTHFICFIVLKKSECKKQLGNEERLRRKTYFNLILIVFWVVGVKKIEKLVFIDCE